MKHASVGIALSTIAFALVLAALATEALGESRTDPPGDGPDLVLPDGSSLTAGPQARWTVASAGDLVITLDRGVLRLAGSQTGTTPVVIGTPSSTLVLRGGIAIVSVTPASTTPSWCRAAR